MSKNLVHGFGLIESLIVITILGILLSVSIPSLRPIIERKSVSNGLESLTSTFQLAADTAARISDITLICPLTNSGRPPCQSQDWSQGWGIYRPDRTSRGTNLVLLKKYDPLGQAAKIRGMVDSIIIKKDGFIFKPDNKTLIICHPNQTHYWASISIKRQGIEFTYHDTALDSGC